MRHGPSRTFLTLLLAAAVPLCCCSVEALARAAACGGCAGEAVPACHADPGSGHDDPASGPNGCDCGTQKRSLVTCERPTIDTPDAAPAAIMEWSGAAWTLGVPRLSAYVRREGEAPSRAPTSLLRQHCALIV